MNSEARRSVAAFLVMVSLLLVGIGAWFASQAGTMAVEHPIMAWKAMRSYPIGAGVKLTQGSAASYWGYYFDQERPVICGYGYGEEEGSNRAVLLLKIKHSDDKSCDVLVHPSFIEVMRPSPLSGDQAGYK